MENIFKDVKIPTLDDPNQQDENNNNNLNDNPTSRPINEDEKSLLSVVIRNERNR